MTDLPLIFLGGLLGSSHCIGMCGPLALALGVESGRLSTNVGRQLLFSAGRIFTYGFLGAVAGASGWWLTQRPQAFVNMQSALSIVAGVALVWLGLSTAGVLPRLGGKWLNSTPCLAVGWFKTLLMSPNSASALLAGMFTGFIPCGLVYAFVVYAASSGSPVQGWATMAAFGLGTVPLMVLAGFGGSLLTLSARAKVLQVAAWCVVLTGLISVARGAGYLELMANAAPAGCQFCH
ncbi:MAG: sulfite exporter TauE/SafE family protein [Pirellulales bacterium]